MSPALIFGTETRIITTVTTLISARNIVAVLKDKFLKRAHFTIFAGVFNRNVSGFSCFEYIKL